MISFSLGDDDIVQEGRKMSLHMRFAFFHLSGGTPPLDGSVIQLDLRCHTYCTAPFDSAVVGKPCARTASVSPAIEVGQHFRSQARRAIWIRYRSVKQVFFEEIMNREVFYELTCIYVTTPHLLA